MNAGAEVLELAGFAAAGAAVACLHLLALACAVRRLVAGGARAAAALTALRLALLTGALTAIRQIMRRLRPEGRDGPTGW